MKLVRTTAIAIAAAAAFATPAVAQDKQQNAAAQPQIKPSSKALKPIVDLQTAVNNKDYASVPAKVAAAQAVASTKEDKYLIARLQLQAAVANNDNAAVSTAIEAISASNFLDPAKVADLYTGLGGTYFNAKQYAQAAAAYQKALALNPRNTEAANMVGDALIGAGQKAEAAALFQRQIQASLAAGQKPDENLLKRAVAVAYESKSPTAVELARQWVAAYPSPSSWSDAIGIYSNLNQQDVEGIIDLLRLRQAVGAMKTGAEYAQYARAAAEQNNFNEAQAVLDAGIAANAIDPKASEYADLVTGLKAKQKATAADLAVATKQAATGNALVRIGDRYLAMGDSAKAVEAYKLAIAKPGTDVAVANLHLGMALAKAGDKAGATAALNAVTGPRADIAKFWLTYLNQKG
jgi:tetratricopeptide (TPR) repeat protein